MLAESGHSQLLVLLIRKLLESLSRTFTRLHVERQLQHAARLFGGESKPCVAAATGQHVQVDFAPSG